MVIHYVMLTCRYTDKNKLQVDTTKNTDSQNIMLYSFIHFIYKQEGSQSDVLYKHLRKRTLIYKKKLNKKESYTYILYIRSIKRFVESWIDIIKLLNENINFLKNISINHLQNMLRVQQKIVKRFSEWKYNLS